MDTNERDERRYLYEQFLQCIDREENLIHYRLSWGIQWNAAILAAVFAMSQLQLPEVLELVIRIMLSLLGAVSGYLSFIGVNAAFTQSKFLIEGLEDRLEIQEKGGWGKSEFLRPFGESGTVHLPARKAAIRFPWLFMGVWGGFIVYTGVQLLNALGIIIVPALQ